MIKNNLNRLNKLKSECDRIKRETNEFVSGIIGNVNQKHNGALNNAYPELYEGQSALAINIPLINGQLPLDEALEDLKRSLSASGYTKKLIDDNTALQVSFVFK